MSNCVFIPMMRVSRQTCLDFSDPEQDYDDLNVSSSSSSPLPLAKSPFNKQTFTAIEIGLRVVCIGILGLVGLISNILNIIVFHKQGILSNSSTVSLTSLAISDLFCCFFNVWGSICVALKHITDVKNFDWDVEGFITFTSVRPLDLFTQITCWITFLTTFERFISVVLPFKVRELFTPKRSLLLNLSILILTCILYFPNSFEEIPSLVGHKHANNTAKTILGWKKSGLRIEHIRRVFFLMSPVILRFSAIILVVLCNGFILINVRMSQKFRSLSTIKTDPSKQKNHKSNDSDPDLNLNGSKISNEQHSGSNKSTSGKEINRNSKTSSSKLTKEIKLLRMVVVISLVFVVCYTPNAVYVIVCYIVFKWGYDYHPYLDYMGWYIVTLFQTLNAATNIVIYFNMSSRFHQTFLAMWKKTDTTSRSETFSNFRIE